MADPAPNVTPPVPPGQPVPIPPGAGSVTATKRTSPVRAIVGALLAVIALLLPYLTSEPAVGSISLLSLPWYVPAIIGGIGVWLIGGADPPSFLRDSLTYIFTRGLPFLQSKPEEKDKP